MRRFIPLLLIVTLLAALTLASSRIAADGFKPFPVTPPALTIVPPPPTFTPTPPPVYFPRIDNGA